MLILGRRTGDSIVIDGGIRIVVLACERNGVRLGIEAPPEIVILRGEIVNQVVDSNRRATAGVDAKAWVDSLLDAHPANGTAPAKSPTPAPVPPARRSREKP